MLHLVRWFGLRFYVQVISYGHAEMVSSPDNTFFWASLTIKEVNQYFVHILSWKEENDRSNYTPGRRQSKTLSTIDKRGSKIFNNSVFDCHLSPVWRQMAIKNTVSNDFLSKFLDSISVFDCRLPGVNYFMINLQKSMLPGQGRLATPGSSV